MIARSLPLGTDQKMKASLVEHREVLTTPFTTAGETLVAAENFAC